MEWYPWGAEALERARAEDKPILLSIGYAACHWCHVMAHESFEDPDTARLMNESFVNIKVDREERPDLDSIYMQAVQAMTGHGGWPMTMFLTPEGVPFYGGTYFPPADRHGIPSFARILTTVASAYRDQRGRVAETVDAMRRLYSDVTTASGPSTKPDARTLEMAFRNLSRRYDGAFGGFDAAPKFPPTMALEFLLRYWRRTGNADALRMVHETFTRMARGGIYDQLAGGFSRYSVDAKWIVPHFEKMLYDNALLIRLGARLWRATHDDEVRRVTEATIDWARRDLCSPEGGFYSSWDADSDGEEGLYYVWTPDELDALLGSDSAVIKEYFGGSPEGNFEGKTILTRPAPDGVVAARAGVSVEELETVVARARAKLMQARELRVPPERDDKIIASWNGLMARALAEAAQAFDNDEYAAMSLRCTSFLFTKMTREESATDGSHRLRAMRTYNRGEARIGGFLEDHASLGLAAISAYELTFDVAWLERARALARSCKELFGGTGAEGAFAGYFYDTATGEEVLVTRPRDVSDNAIPSGTSLAAELLLLVGEYFGDAAATEMAESVVASLGATVTQYPTAFGNILCAADTCVHGTLQVAIIGDTAEARPMRRALADIYIPALLLAGSREGDSSIPLLAGKTAVNNMATAYVCRSYLCDAPTTSPENMLERIDEMLRSSQQS